MIDLDLDLEASMAEMVFDVDVAIAEMKIDLDLETENLTIELLEIWDGERLDGRTKGATISGNL